MALCSSPLRRRVVSYQQAGTAACLLLVGLPLFCAATEPPINVLTNHNDNMRTGANLHEKRLTVGTISAPGLFGKLFSRTVDGQIYAQPLYLSDVEMADTKRHNVVFVATTHDTVYAYDADNADGRNDHWLWKTSLLLYGHAATVKATPVPSSDYDSFFQRYTDLRPEIGVMGTPVISQDGKTIYVVAATKENGLYVHRLHALNTRDGKELPRSPVTIDGSVPGIGDNTDGSVRFRPRQQMARPALLLANGMVYVAFASHGDQIWNAFSLRNVFDLLPGYHGWLFAYDAATLQCCDVFNTTPNGGLEVVEAAVQNRFGGGGIWMSGAGPAADDTGNIYVSVGNGHFDADTRHNGSDYGDSVLKLSQDPLTRRLQVAGFFTPANQQELEDKDLDLGSCGVLLLPAADDPKRAPLMVAGGKQGMLYLMNRNAPGGFKPDQDACLQSFLAAYTTSETRKQHKEDLVAEHTASQPHHEIERTKAHRQLNERLARDQGIAVQTLERQHAGAEVSNIHGAPVYWQSPVGSLVYIWGEVDFLKAFHLVNDRFVSAESSESSASKRIDPVGHSVVRAAPGMPGAMLALSADGSTPGTGILWASHPYKRDANHDVVPGILQAFDATPASGDIPAQQKGELRLLWNSKQDPADDPGDFAKFCPPTVVNGKVYLGTFSNQLEIYGTFKQPRQELYVRQDTYVQAGSFADTPLNRQRINLGRQLNVSRASGMPTSTLNRCAYLKFDLTRITTAPKSASLMLTVYQQKPTDGEMTVQVYGYPNAKDQEWDQAHTTWNNAPGLNRAAFDPGGGDLLATHRVFNKPGSVTFDVTDFISRHLGAIVTLQLFPASGKSGSVTFIGHRDTAIVTPAAPDRSSQPDPVEALKAGQPLLTLTWY